GSAWGVGGAAGGEPCDRSSNSVLIGNLLSTISAFLARVGPNTPGPDCCCWARQSEAASRGIFAPRRIPRRNRSRHGSLDRRWPLPRPPPRQAILPCSLPRRIFPCGQT